MWRVGFWYAATRGVAVGSYFHILSDLVQHTSSWFFLTLIVMGH